MIGEIENGSRARKPSENGLASDIDGKVETSLKLIRGICDSLDIKGAKEYFPPRPRDAKVAAFEEAQLWCEALRMRS
jgi:hypothetical protein